MAKKRKAAAKKPTKPAANQRTTPAQKPSPPRPSSRPTRPSPPVGASAAAEGNSRGEEVASFAEAKSAAIDALIQAIEDAERKLTELKRANSFDEMQPLTQGPTE